MIDRFFFICFLENTNLKVIAAISMKKAKTKRSSVTKVVDIKTIKSSIQEGFQFKFLTKTFTFKELFRLMRFLLFGLIPFFWISGLNDKIIVL